MNQLGYYGKTPHRGDFVRFNLPQAFLKVWDDWLQQVMILGESHCQDWATLYTRAPSWRFVLSGGIAGNTPWIGVLRASQDKVGRRFPFCLAMSLSEDALPCASLNLTAPWFDDADKLLDRVLLGDDTFDELQGELTRLAELHARIADAPSKPVVLNNSQPGDAVTIGVTSGHALSSSNCLPTVLDTVLSQTLGEYSLWMTSAPTELTVINAGLPVDNAGLALFSADWDAASTAQINVDLLAEKPGPANALHPCDEKGPEQSIRTDTIRTDRSTTGSPDGDQSPDKMEDVVTIARLDKDSKTIEIFGASSTPAIEEQVPSADDWAALDDFANTSNDESKVVVPEVEPLELDEDDLPDAPWEN